jgi:hypothetical protein
VFTSIHPIVLMALLAAGAALVAVIVASRTRRGLVRGMMVVLALVFLAPAAYVFQAFHPELVDGRFRTYKAFYRDIQLGMTREQVFAAFEHRYPQGGPRQRPKLMQDEPGRLGFFMNSETSREPNCEGIFLTLEHGRVTRKDYSPD